MTHDQSRAFGYVFRSAQILRWRDLGDAPLELARPFADGVALARRLGKTLTVSDLPGAGDGDEVMRAKLAGITEDDFN